MPELFLATRNRGKVAEMERILQALAPEVRVLGLGDVTAYDEPVEDQPDFAGNALLKARAGLAATGLPSLADDSGLCVDALNGMPGVLSARWSGPPKSDARNNDLLLAQLADVPPDRRAAHFTCAVAFCYPAGSGGVVEHVVHGEMAGRIVSAPAGTGGFGYDVVFAADGYDVTTAELPPGEKDRISHRGQAVRDIAPYVVDVLTGL